MRAQWLDKEIKELKTQLKALWASNGGIVTGPQVASSRLARWMPSWGRAKRQADEGDDGESANVPKPSKAPKKADGLDSEDRAATSKRSRHTPEQYQAEPARREGNQDTISGTKMPVSPPASVGVPYPVGTLCEFLSFLVWCARARVCSLQWRDIEWEEQEGAGPRADNVATRSVRLRAVEASAAAGARPPPGAGRSGASSARGPADP